MKFILSDTDFLLPKDFTKKEAQEYLDKFVSYQEYADKNENIVYALVGGEEIYIEIKKRIELTRQEIKKKFPVIDVNPKIKTALGKSKRLKPEKKSILDEVRRVGVRI